LRIQNRWYPKTFVYKDVLKDGKGTKMMIGEMQLDATIPATIFNVGNLK